MENQDENIYAAPQSEEVINMIDGEHKPLTLKQKLWGFNGRISRAGYWGYCFSWLILISIPFYIFYGVLMYSIAGLESGGDLNIALMIGTGIGMLICMVPMMWMSIAIIVKRFHDRGKSGWWALVAFIPYVGSIWILIECGCLAGQKGRNQYGDDPLLADGKTHN